MDQQSGESENEEVVGDRSNTGCRKWRKWYQNTVDEEMGVDPETR